MLFKWLFVGAILGLFLRIFRTTDYRKNESKRPDDQWVSAELQPDGTVMVSPMKKVIQRSRKIPDWVKSELPPGLNSRLRLEAYVAKYKAPFMKKLNDLKATSLEWESATAAKRKKLMKQWKLEAARSLDIFFDGCQEFLEQDSISVADIKQVERDTCELAASYFEDFKRHRKAGISKWAVSTSNDERTCPLCLLSAKKSPYSEMVAMPLHMYCRCVVMARL